MRRDRVWVAGSAATSVAVAAAGWLFFVSPQLDADASSERQLADTQMTNAIVQQQTNALRHGSDPTNELRAELASLQAAVPQTHDLAGFTRQLQAQATAAGVAVQSIVPHSAAPVERLRTVSDSADQGAANEDDDAGGSADGDATDSGQDGDSLQAIGVTVVTTGTVTGQRTLLSTIETDGTRRALVTSADLALAPLGSTAEVVGQDDEGDADSAPVSPSDTRWSMTTQLTVFIAASPPDSDDH